jgi:hypothetical protein
MMDWKELNQWRENVAGMSEGKEKERELALLITEAGVDPNKYPDPRRQLNEVFREVNRRHKDAPRIGRF